MPTDITLTGGAGEYMESATFVGWSVEVGAAVRRGDVLATVETAKAATEIEAPCDGTLSERLAAAGEEIAVGRVLGRITTPAEGVAPATAVSPTTHPPATPPQTPRRGGDPRVIASPLARRIAKERGLSLHGVAGSGWGGRIKARDLAAMAAAPQPASASIEPASPVTPSWRGRTETMPVVLLHGFGSNAATWNLFLPRLGALPRFTPELPGHGRQPRPGTTFDELVSSVLQDLDARGHRSVHLVGHSLGGAVAAAVAQSGAVETLSLTLIAPAGLGPGIDRGFIDGFVRARTVDALQPWLDLLVDDPDRLPPGLAEMVLRERKTHGSAALLPKQAGTLFPDGTQTFSVRERIGSLGCPTRVIWGARDRIIPVSHAADLDGSIGLHFLAGVGHLPYIEAPELVARLVTENVRSGAAV